MKYHWIWLMLAYTILTNLMIAVCTTVILQAIKPPVNSKKEKLHSASINRPVLDLNFTTITEGKKPLLIIGINQEFNLFEVRYHDKAILSINDEGLITGIEKREIGQLNKTELPIFKQLFGYYMEKNTPVKISEIKND